MSQIEVKSVQLIRSLDEYGCGVACLAMVMGTTYSDVAMRFATNFNLKSFKPKWYETFLYDHGCTIIKKRLRVGVHIASAYMSGVMLKPFAPIHIVSINQSAEWEICHAVVMDASGMIHDPSGHTHEEIFNSIYAIPSVLGIWRPGDYNDTNATPSHT